MTTYRIFDNDTGHYIGPATTEQAIAADLASDDDTAVFCIDPEGAVVPAEHPDARFVFARAAEADDTPSVRMVLQHLIAPFTADGVEGWYLCRQMFLEGCWEDADGELVAAGIYDPGTDISEEHEAHARRVAAERTGLRFDGDAETVAHGCVLITGR